MKETDFTHLIPEWVLFEALNKCCKAGDVSGFWDRLAIVRPTNEYDKPTKFSSLFHPSSCVTIACNKGIPANRSRLYGFPDPEGYKNFANLRPDFRIETEEGTVIVLLEAKGGVAPR